MSACISMVDAYIEQQFITSQPSVLDQVKSVYWFLNLVVAGNSK